MVVKLILQFLFPGKEPLCCIPLDQILAVEKLQEDSFKKNYMFQIVQPERALYIQVFFFFLNVFFSLRFWVMLMIHDIWSILSYYFIHVQANNCVEEKEWIDILTKICQTNANRLSSYHPSAFINGHWLW